MFITSNYTMEVIVMSTAPTSLESLEPGTRVDGTLKNGQAFSGIFRQYEKQTAKASFTEIGTDKIFDLNTGEIAELFTVTLSGKKTFVMRHGERER